MVIQTPPMGWNSWNTFAQDINEDLILGAAKAMVDSGLKDAGYKYVVIDDCWSLLERGKDGRIVADPEKFPHGMKYVADEIHKLGLKFGMYSCDGPLTCASYPGSYDREWIDAKTFAKWGVDYLKYDNCFKSYMVATPILYRRMGLALANCGRNIVFSACSWGADKTEEWIKSTGAHLFRSTGDIFDSFASIKDLILQQDEHIPYVGHGCFNDMDMLIVGMHGVGHVGIENGCTKEEYRTHMNAWALYGSPLMIGCDVRKMDEDTKELLMNPELIAIDQDPALCQLIDVDDYAKRSSSCRVYARFLSNGDIALGLFNLGDEKRRIHFGLDTMGVSRVNGMTLRLRDVWTKEEETVVNETVSKTLEPHTSLLYRCKLVPAK